MEEATEFTYADYITLLTRLSAPITTKDVTNQIFLTLNPSDSSSWIAKNLLKQKNTKVINSSYKDNPFLNRDYIETLLSLKDTDENYYQIFALGKWGSKQNIIYNNYSFVDAIEKYEDIIWG